MLVWPEIGLKIGSMDQLGPLVWAVFGGLIAGQTSIWLVTWGICIYKDDVVLNWNTWYPNSLIFLGEPSQLWSHQWTHSLVEYPCGSNIFLVTSISYTLNMRTSCLLKMDLILFGMFSFQVFLIQHLPTMWFYCPSQIYSAKGRYA